MGKLSGTSLVSSLADAITRMEGFIAPNSQYPNGSLAYQNNNPGNLVYVGPNQNGQTGVTKGPGGFARFQSVDSGRAALEWQVQNYIDRGYNLQQFFYTYAPPNTKNDAGGVQTQSATDNYISQVAQQVGLDPSVTLKNYQTGDAQAGTYIATTNDPTAIDPTSDSSSVLDASISTDFGSTGGIMDTIANADPLVIGAVGVAIVGALYVFFGPSA